MKNIEYCGDILLKYIQQQTADPCAQNEHDEVDSPLDYNSIQDALIALFPSQQFNELFRAFGHYIDLTNLATKIRNMGLGDQTVNDDFLLARAIELCRIVENYAEIEMLTVEDALLIKQLVQLPFTLEALYNFIEEYKRITSLYK